jgi:HK97 family phage major capsid protein
MSEDVNGVVSALGKAFEEFKTAHSEEMGLIKKGAADYVTSDKLNRINAELDRLTELKSRIDAIETKANRPRAAGAAGELSGEQIEHKQAFNAFLRKGREQGLDGLQAKAMQAGSDVDGGYLVPTDMSGRIVSKVYETTAMRQIASVVSISTDKIEGMKDNDEGSLSGWTSEGGTRSTSSTPALGKWSISVHEHYAMPEVTQSLLDDANMDVESWIANKIADKFARTQNAAFVSGTGVGQPRGFTTYTTNQTADASRSWGVLESVKTGVSSDFAASNPADHLFDLISRFKPAYLNGATFMLPRSVLAKIRKFKSSTGEYLWQPALTAGAPATLLAFPIVMSEDLPTLASGSLSLWLGNFKEAYLIVDRIGIRTMRDPFTNKPFVRFYSTAKVGGDVIQFEAIKALQFGA